MLARSLSRSARAVVLAAAVLVSGGMPADAGGRTLACYRQTMVPAVYQTVQQQVLVRPAGVRFVDEPAVYAMQSRRVLLQPERVSYRKIAPIYETRSRQVLVRPASVGWEYQLRKGGKVLCKVLHPAVYQTVQETVLIKPGGRVAVTHPAIYGTVREQVLVRPASRRKVHVPAVYQTVSRKVKVRDARVVWQPVTVKGCRR